MACIGVKGNVPKNDTNTEYKLNTARQANTSLYIGWGFKNLSSKFILKCSKYITI